MAINVFGNPPPQPRKPKAISRTNTARAPRRAKAQWYVKVEGETVGAFVTRIQAERFATAQRRKHKKRGSVKVSKR